MGARRDGFQMQVDVQGISKFQFHRLSITRTIMPFNVLGKVLFPRLQPWERRRRMKFILRVLSTAVILGGTVGMMIYRQGVSRH
jgi:hypothetical protein